MKKKNKSNKQIIVKKQPSLFAQEWVRFVVVMAVVIGFSWLTASKVLLVNQNPVKEEKPQLNPKTVQQSMKIGLAGLMVEVRKTEAEQALGLSWRQSMDENEGMVFVYPQPQKVLFWMKGMQFPLDFIWTANGKVVEVTSNVSQPTTENPVVRTVVPTGLIDQVIEVNAGWVEKNGVKIGDEVRLEGV